MQIYNMWISCKEMLAKWRRRGFIGTSTWIRFFLKSKRCDVSCSFGIVKHKALPALLHVHWCPQFLFDIESMPLLWLPQRTVAGFHKFSISQLQKFQNFQSIIDRPQQVNVQWIIIFRMRSNVSLPLAVSFLRLVLLQPLITKHCS